MDDVGRSRTFKVTAAAGLLVLLGAGCMAQAPVSPVAQVSKEVLEKNQALLSLKTNWSHDQWQIEGVEKVCSLENAEKLFESFFDWKALRASLDAYKAEGWTVAKFCYFPNAIRRAAFVLTKQERDPKSGSQLDLMRIGTYEVTTGTESSATMNLGYDAHRHVQDIDTAQVSLKDQDTNFQVFIDGEDLVGSWIDQYSYNIATKKVTHVKTFSNR